MGTITKNIKITDLPNEDQSGVDYTKRNLGTRLNDPTTGKPLFDTIALTEGGIATVALNAESITAK